MPATPTAASDDRQHSLIHQRLDEQGHRLNAHDGRLNNLETKAATQALQIAHIDARLTEIQTGVKWILQLVIGGIVMGAIAFVLSGGLNVAS